MESYLGPEALCLKALREHLAQVSSVQDSFILDR